MKRFILTFLVITLSVGSMAARCETLFEKRCREAGGVVISDPEDDMRQKCHKDGKEIQV